MKDMENTPRKAGPEPTAPCGTVSAFKRHQRNHEPIDDACRDAYNAEQRRLYRNRKQEERT